MSFFGELRRRNVVKVAVAYAIVGWLLIEISSTVLPTFEAPAWVLQTITFVIILGFPLAVVLSWIFDLTPQGVERTGAATESGSVTSVSGRKLDFAIIGALVLALGFVVYNYESEDALAPTPEVIVDEVINTLPVVVEEEREVLPNSVAVLPFENLSPDPDNEYYAAGIHEEILNQLVKLSALNVIARTSVQQYANTEKSIPEIARELNVETVMEGSVRYDAGRIRITAQLNDGVTGAHLWSETYTRDFDDIFAIESDVAMNVANAVGAEFSLEEQASIEKIPTDSTAAYALYIHALDVAYWPFTEALSYLDRAIEIDPNFALAYAKQAQFRAGTIARDAAQDRGNEARRAAELEGLVRENAEKALGLDPDLGIPYAALALIYERRWSSAEAQDAYDRAIELSPNDTEILAGYSRFRLFTGQQQEAIRLAERAVELDPNRFEVHLALGDAHFWARDSEASMVAYRKVTELEPAFGIGYYWLASAEALGGNYASAYESLQLGEQIEGTPPNGYGGQNARAAYVYAMAGYPEDAMRIAANMDDTSSTAQLALALMAVGDYEDSLRLLQETVASELPEQGEHVVNIIKYNVWSDPILEQPDWLEVRERLGYSDL